ncbi:MAG: O-antigen ligase family protein [Aliiglaciecola sp.]|uniref:O-antigen ligase family protein n=1 Tax=Aliiglaciecola sp. TaxID=1872441 RepID=UPI003298A624
MVHASQRHQDSKVLLFLMGILILLPWFRGGEIQWQYSFFQVCIYLTLCIAIFKRRSSNFQELSSIKFSLTVWSLYLLCTVIQTIPLPIGVVNFINPSIVDWYQGTYNIINRQTLDYAPLTLSQDATQYESLKQTSYFALFISFLLAIRTKKQAKTVLTVIMVTTTLASLYALANYLTKGSILYLKPLPPWNGSNHTTITGPLSYKNHFAALLILTIPLALGLLTTYKTSKLSHHPLGFLLSGRAFFLLVGVFLFFVLIFNTSRGGLLALVVSLLLSFALFKPKKILKTFHFKSWLKTSVAVIAMVLIILLSGLSDRLINRLESYGQNGRDIQRQTALTILSDFPATGSGAGTFPIIQNSYKSEFLSGNKMWQHVHNDYLELLSNQGILGFILMGLTIAFLIFKLYSSIKLNERSTKWLQISCFTSCNAFLIHSLIDFNFQLPVLAAYFVTILAVGLKIPTLRKAKRILTSE